MDIKKTSHSVLLSRGNFQVAKEGCQLFYGYQYLYYFFLKSNRHRKICFSKTNPCLTRTTIPKWWTLKLQDEGRHVTVLLTPEVFSQNSVYFAMLTNMFQPVKHENFLPLASNYEQMIKSGDWLGKDLILIFLLLLATN